MSVLLSCVQCVCEPHGSSLASGSTSTSGYSSTSVSPSGSSSGTAAAMAFAVARARLAFLLRRLPGHAERYMIYTNHREDACLIADDFSNSTLYTGTQAGLQLIVLSSRCDDNPRAIFRLEQLAPQRSVRG